ncbi:cell division protein FtsQ/DivIB [Brachymonas sp. M4Q-1]|uniref:cell division protein FtsQ/DivIB n=1 Tax=Brachymonas sp. M4Q-1 TaxID=3416906 RepID=UPI003CF8553E
MTRTPSPSAPVSSPVDARLMNAAASLLIGLVVVGALGVAGWRLMRLPVFSLTGIEVTGDTEHSTAAAVRNQVLPQLRGNFFTIRLEDVQSAFQSLPWVRAAVVRREFPNRLAVRIQEQKEAAFWGDDEEGYRLLNEQGDIFDADPDEASSQNLPELAGPDAESAAVLAMYRRLNPVLAPLHAEAKGLRLDRRGYWTLSVGDATQINLGSGTPEELTARLAQFVLTIPPVAARYGRVFSDVEYADLRYKTGYAIRLKGIGTLDSSTPQPPGVPPVPGKKAKT